MQAFQVKATMWNQNMSHSHSCNIPPFSLRLAPIHIPQEQKTPVWHIPVFLRSDMVWHKWQRSSKAVRQTWHIKSIIIIYIHFEHCAGWLVCHGLLLLLRNFLVCRLSLAARAWVGVKDQVMQPEFSSVSQSQFRQHDNWNDLLILLNTQIRQTATAPVLGSHMFGSLGGTLTKPWQNWPTPFKLNICLKTHHMFFWELSWAGHWLSPRISWMLGPLILSPVSPVTGSWLLVSYLLLY